MPMQSRAIAAAVATVFAPSLSHSFTSHDNQSFFTETSSIRTSTSLYSSCNKPCAITEASTKAETSCNITTDHTTGIDTLSSGDLVLASVYPADRNATLYVGEECMEKFKPRVPNDASPGSAAQRNVQVCKHPMMAALEEIPKLLKRRKRSAPSASWNGEVKAPPLSSASGSSSHKGHSHSAAVCLGCLPVAEVACADKDGMLLDNGLAGVVWLGIPHQTAPIGNFDLYTLRDWEYGMKETHTRRKGTLYVRHRIGVANSQEAEEIIARWSGSAPDFCVYVDHRLIVGYSSANNKVPAERRAKFESGPLWPALPQPWKQPSLLTEPTTDVDKVDTIKGIPLYISRHAAMNALLPSGNTVRLPGAVSTCENRTVHMIRNSRRAVGNSPWFYVSRQKEVDEEWAPRVFEKLIDLSKPNFGIFHGRSLYSLYYDEAGPINLHQLPAALRACWPVKSSWFEEGPLGSLIVSIAAAGSLTAASSSLTSSPPSAKKEQQYRVIELCRGSRNAVNKWRRRFETDSTQQASRPEELNYRTFLNHCMQCREIERQNVLLLCPAAYVPLSQLRVSLAHMRDVLVQVLHQFRFLLLWADADALSSHHSILVSVSRAEGVKAVLLPDSEPWTRQTLLLDHTAPDQTTAAKPKVSQNLLQLLGQMLATAAFRDYDTQLRGLAFSLAMLMQEKEVTPETCLAHPFLTDMAPERHVVPLIAAYSNAGASGVNQQQQPRQCHNELQPQQELLHWPEPQQPQLQQQTEEKERQLQRSLTYQQQHRRKQQQLADQHPQHWQVQQQQPWLEQQQQPRHGEQQQQNQQQQSWQEQQQQPRQGEQHQQNQQQQSWQEQQQQPWQGEQHQQNQQQQSWQEQQQQIWQEQQQQPWQGEQHQQNQQQQSWQEQQQQPWQEQQQQSWQGEQHQQNQQPQQQQPWQVQQQQLMQEQQQQPWQGVQHQQNQQQQQQQPWQVQQQQPWQVQQQQPWQEQ